MPLPKSVVKISKKGVEYTESVDRANYLITELTRRALLDVGRFVLYRVRAKVKGINKYVARNKYAPLRYDKWVRKKETDLQLGIENTQRGAVSAWWADQAELGTNGQPKRGFLRSTVYDNIDEIRRIEAQYLSAVEDEIRAAELITEDVDGLGED